MAQKEGNLATILSPNSSLQGKETIMIDSNDEMPILENEADIHSYTIQTKDISLVDSNLVQPIDPQLPLKVQINQTNEDGETDPNKCPECKMKNKKIIKMEEQILELEEAIKKSNPFTPANLLKPIEVKDRI